MLFDKIKRNNDVGESAADEKKSGQVDVEISTQTSETKHKLRLQKWGELSRLRKGMIIAFGSVFLVCLIRVLTGTRGLAVAATSVVSFAVTVGAYLWNLLDLGQRCGQMSNLRRVVFVVFGVLFLWCLMPAFFHIRGIGVVSSSLIMLFISMTAYFWDVIDRWQRGSLFGRSVCVGVGCLFTAGLVAFCFVSGLMLKASMTTLPKNKTNYTVVVLGCKAYQERPSWMLHDRLEKAYKVLSDDPDVMCVVTGGMGDDEQFTEAHVMKKYLVDKGIAAERIIEEDRSSSTEENLLFTKAVIKLNGMSENIVIVTDRFHELRARMWAEKAGFHDIYSACCETRPYLVIGYWFREMFGLARLYIFGI